jgi:hypothetical protein
VFVKEQFLGAVLGLLLGLGVAFLLERFDRRIREPKDLEGIYGLPLLGVVPESTALSRSSRGKKNAGEVLPASEAEAFQLIRAHLRYFNVDRELRTLLIASAAPGGWEDDCCASSCGCGGEDGCSGSAFGGRWAVCGELSPSDPQPTPITPSIGLY